MPRMSLRHNISMQRPALSAAADTERWAATTRISRSWVAVFLLAFLSSAAASDNPPAERPVVLVGVLQVGEFFGPPGYGENPATDSVERPYYLQLPTPLAEQRGFQGLPADTDSAARDTYFVELVFLKETKPPLSVGARIEVRGQLFGAISGHHHTPVLLQVENFRVLRLARTMSAKEMLSN